MKHSHSAVFIVVVAFLTLTAPLVAQQSPFLINVPFAFSVGTQMFPAGEYRVQEIRQGTLYIRGVDSTASAFVISSSTSKAERPSLSKLVFRRYGSDRYFLAQAWFDGSRRGDQLPTSNMELQFAKPGPKIDTELSARSK